MVLRLTLRTQGRNTAARELNAGGGGPQLASRHTVSIGVGAAGKQRPKKEDSGSCGQRPRGPRGVVAKTRGQGRLPETVRKTKLATHEKWSNPVKQEKGQGGWPRSPEGRLTRKTRPQRPRIVMSYFKTSRKTVKDGASQEVGRGNIRNRRK